MSQLVSDDFNRANGALGANWTSISTGGQAMEVSANQCGMPTGAGEGLAYYSGAGWTGGADQYAEAKAVALQSGRDIAAACRVSGASVAAANAYLMVINSDDVATGFGSMKVTLYKQVAGAFTEITTAVTTSVSANDVIRVEAQGTTIRGKINGTTVVSVTDASLSSGNPGLYVGSGNGSRWDDFAAGDFSGGATDTGRRLQTRVRPAPFRPMGDAFRTGKFRGWR